MMRRGFTLIEMLVATGVFLIGFAAVYTMFLAGTRFRQLAETTSRASLAATSLISEIGIDAGHEGVPPRLPHQPVDYVGSGFATTPSGPGTNTLSDPLYPYPAQPGLYYRVMGCTDLQGNSTGQNAALTTTLRLTLLVVPWSDTVAPGSSLTFADINQRLRLGLPGGTPSSQIAATLVSEGLAMQYQAVILRHPSWLPP